MSEDVEQLRAALRRAEEALKQRDALLAVIAHELRNPIAPVLLSLEALLLQVAKGPIEQDLLTRRLQQTRRYAQRLRQDLDRLLDFSRQQSGHVDLQPRDTDLSVHVTQCLEDMAPMIQASRCDVQTELESPLIGYWDPLRLDQILWNLVSNALKYAAGSRVDLRTYGDATTATLIVADRGPGIPLDQQQSVFAKFERLAPSMHHTGFGIGLWLVRSIIEAMGGTITLESEVGHGTTFTTTLPRSPK